MSKPDVVSVTSKNGVSPRSKRAAILTAAVNAFGTQGYDDTKWADIANEVGIGATALYHYFESKQHCLYEIMAEAVTAARDAFDDAIRGATTFQEGIVAAFGSGYPESEFEVLRLRVLVDKQGLVGVRRSSPREEAARQVARSRTRDLEFAWATYLVRGMEQGVIPEDDSRLLTRAILGINTSIWHWYRSGGETDLGTIKQYFMRKQLKLVGMDPALALTQASQGLPIGGERTNGRIRLPG